MSILFVVEDSAKDLWSAEDAANAAGFTSIVGHANVDAVLKRLSTMLKDGSELPNAFLIDLDFGQESGYELLRFRHSLPKLSGIPAVVWTHLDSHHRDMCEVFGISEFVQKADGPEALKTALAKLLPQARGR